MALTGPERETVITTSDGQDFVEIYTVQAKVIRRLRKDDRVAIVAEGEFDGSEWVTARVAAHLWSPTGGLKRKVNMTEEQREAAAERLRKAREAR